MILWRGKASYLYSTVITIRDHKGNREKAWTVSRMTLRLWKFPVPEGTFGKSFWRLLKLWQSHRVSLSRVESRRLELIPRTWENARTSLKMTLRTSGNSQCLKEPLGRIFKGYQSFCKATESFQVELRRPWTLYSGYGNRVQTQRSHFDQGFGGFGLNPEVSVSFVTFRNSTMDVYTLTCITMYF